MRLKLQKLICPHCRQKYSHTAWLSGNTFGAVVFSDTKIAAAMLRYTVTIIKCSQCNSFVWIRDMEEEGDVQGYGGSKCLATKPLGLQEIAEALASNVATDKEDERYLRFTLWWLFNDRIRHRNLFSKFLSKLLSLPTESYLWKNDEEKKLWRENLNSLFNLMDVSKPEDQLIQAEICREQGEFERALGILNGISTPNLKLYVQAISQRCRDNIPFVFAVLRKR